MPPKRDWPALLEAGCVFALVMLYIWRVRAWQPLAWIPVLCGLVLSHAVHAESPAGLGFGWRAFREARTLLPWILGAASALALAGWLSGAWRRATPAYVLGSLVLYCLWGLFQQYVLNGFFLNRLLAFWKRPRRSAAAAAILFSAAHAPNWFLMLLTLAGGYASALVYLRYRSLYWLGLAHGSLAFLIFMLVPKSISGHFYVGPRY